MEFSPLFYTVHDNHSDRFKIGPQIEGQQNVELYKKYTYSINDSKAYLFSWTGNNIKIISGQNSSTVTVVPINTGTASIKATYKHGSYTGVFTNEYSLNVSKTSMRLIGPDVICNNGTFTLNNFPTGATIDWVVSNGLYSALNQTNSSITLNNMATPGESSINATLTATVHTYRISSTSSKSTTYNIADIQEYKHNINGYFSEHRGQCELSPVPEGASDFHWYIDNGWNVDMQGYHLTSFSSTNEKPFSGTIWATVDFTDACGQRATIYNNFEVGTSRSASGNTEKVTI